MSQAVDAGLAISHWGRMLRDRWKTGLGIFVAVLLLGTWLVLTAHPVYRAETQLRIEPPPPATGVSPTGLGLFGGLIGMGGDAFAGDMELITSRTVAEGVTADNALHVTLRAPRGWIRDSLFEHLRADESTTKSVFRLEWTDRGVTVRQRSPSHSLIGTFAPGILVKFGDITAVFKDRTGVATPPRVQLVTVPFGEAVRKARSSLDVSRPRINANLVEISFDYPDPAVALGAVKSAVDQFVTLRTDILSREARQAADSLRSVAGQTLAELRNAERSFQRLQEATRLVAPEEQGEELVGRFAEANLNLTRARLELQAIESVLAAVDTASAPSKSWTTLISYPRFLQNETIAGVLEQMVDLEQRNTEVATRRLPENRERRVVEEQVADLNSTLRSLATAVRDGLVKDVDGLQRQVEEMDSILAALPALTTEFGRLQRTVLILSQVYTLTEQRLRQEELREALTFSNVQLVDPPALRFRPVWPRKKLGIAVVGMLAMGFAIFGVLVRERADHSVRYSSEIERVLGVPVLAVFPTDRSGVVFLPATDGLGARPVTLVGVGDPSVVRSVAHAMGNGGSPATMDSHGVALIEEPLTSAKSAVEAGASGTPIVVVVEWGKTRIEALQRAASLLDRAGERPYGALLVFPRPTVPRHVFD